MMCRGVVIVLVMGLMLSGGTWTLARQEAGEGGREGGREGGNGVERFEFTRLAMGDMARIVVYSSDEEGARSAAAAAFDRIEELEGVMTDYKPESELMRLCAAPGKAAGEPVRVSEDLFEVLSRASELARLTDGAFDPTVGPVVRLWREARKRGELPDEEALATALARVGHEKMGLDAGTRTVRLGVEGMQLDLGGIGKGYAADAAARVLESRGLKNYLVAMGGDIVVGDAPPGEEGWRVSLLGEKGKEVLLARAAISTSGDREQFVEVDGVRYSHIVDPRTGEGRTHRTSVTVVAPDGTTADAMGTALSVLEGHQAPAVLARVPGVSARSETTMGAVVSTRETEGFPQIGGPVHVGRSTPEANVPPEGFTALFNGQDLTGWEPVAADPPVLAEMSDVERGAAAAAARAEMEKQWSVTDGAMHMNGGWTSLRTAEEYGDIELLLDWKIAAGGDSGVYLRECPQIQIWEHADGSGGLYNNQEHPAKPQRVADRPVGEWNTFRIVMIGDEVTVYLNGELVADRVPLENYWARGEPLAATGPIWLQAHGSPLWFRNVFVRRISSPR